MTQLLQNAVFGTALILAAALLRRALGGRLIPEARLALWFVCLVRLLAPAFPESGLSLWGLLPRAGEAAAPAPAPVGGAGNLPAVNAPVSGTMNPGPVPVEPAGAAFPWGTVLLAVWVGVGLALAVRYALRWNRTRRAVAQAIPLPRDDPRYAPLPKCARLREGVMDGAPLTFGAARPTVVLWPGLSGTALDCVLAHEGVHARRRDNLWHYAMALALAAYWWNPAVWLMARLLRRDIELACDRAAVRKLGADRRAEYAETLVALATAGAEPAFCRTFGRRAAEERIRAIMKFKKTTVLGVVLSLALVAGVTAAFASAPKAPAAGQEGDPSNNTPYVVCTNPLCGVEYQHCHIDGEVVRAYDEYPGLLCAHPDCEIEGPHEHDGVQYAGKAGKYVILNQDAGPVASNPPSDLLGGLFDKPVLGEAATQNEDGAVTEYTVNLDILKQNLDRHVAEGTMTQAEADRVWAMAQDFAQGGKALTWSFQGDSGLTLDELHNVCYRDENGKLIPVDPATVVSGFILPNSGTVKYHGRTYNRADLSAETLEWLDWYLALSEEEQLAVSYEPWELREQGTPGTQDAEQPVPDFVPDYDPEVEDSAGAGDDIICGLPTPPTTNCGLEGCTETRLHCHQGENCILVDPAQLPVCPVEGCTVQGVHYHDGVIYRCNGAHCGGVCDGSCAAAWNEADTAPTNPPVSGGHHGEGHGNGYQGGHH